MWRQQRWRDGNGSNSVGASEQARDTSNDCEWTEGINAEVYAILE